MSLPTVRILGALTLTLAALAAPIAHAAEADPKAATARESVKPGSFKPVVLKLNGEADRKAATPGATEQDGTLQREYWRHYGVG